MGGLSMSANASNKGAAKSMQASVVDWYREVRSAHVTALW